MGCRIFSSGSSDDIAIPQSPPGEPRPLEHWERVFPVDDLYIQWVGERWFTADVEHCPYPTEPDPARPGTSIMMRLVSLKTGRSSSALSEEETRCLLERWESRRGRRN